MLAEKAIYRIMASVLIAGLVWSGWIAVSEHMAGKKQRMSNAAVALDEIKDQDSHIRSTCARAFNATDGEPRKLVMIVCSQALDG